MYDWPPHVLEAIQQQVSQFGRTGSTQIVVVPDVAAIAAGTPAPTQSAPQTVTFRDDGIVIAMYGQEIRGTGPAFATTRVKVEIGGSQNIFTDGQSSAFVSMLQLFGGAQNWYPLWRRVKPGVRWTVTYQNLDTGSAATPSASFGFIRDKDIALMARQ